MDTNPANQLEAIRAMMASGHRSVRIDRHSLVLWGVASAFLIITTNLIFFRGSFDHEWLRIAGADIYIVLILLAVGIVDYRMTRHKRARLGETLSFVQRQVTKVWWLVVGLIVLINLGMNLFGGGLMFFPLVLALLGLALYVQGLFSQQMLSWVGLVLIAMGLGSLAIPFSPPALKWLAATTLGLGFPILALVIDKPAVHATFARRTLFTSVWLAIVITATVMIHKVSSSSEPSSLPKVALADYVANPSAHPNAEVQLPARTRIPVQFNIEGGLLQGGTLTITLRQPLTLTVKNGELTGHYRTADGRSGKGVQRLFVRTTRIAGELRAAAGPHVTLKLLATLR